MLDLVEVIERVVLEDVRNVVGMRQDGLQGDQGELTQARRGISRG